MKKCSQCGKMYPDDLTRCPTCGLVLTGESEKRENVGKGILGAILFGLGGLVIQVIIMYIGYVAAIAGIITYFLTITGYKKFSGVGDDSSKVAIWVCIPVSLAMIAGGTFLAVAIEGMKVLNAGFLEASQLILEVPELMDIVKENFGMTVLFWGISVVVTFVQSLVKRKKNR